MLIYNKNNYKSKKDYNIQVGGYFAWPTSFINVFHGMGTGQPWIVSMAKVANMTIWGGGCQVISWQVRQWAIYNRQHVWRIPFSLYVKDLYCSRYKGQNVWFLLKSPHMPSSPPWLIAFIIEQTIDHKSLTNVCHIKFVSSTSRYSPNRVSILNCGYRHWLAKQIKQTYKRNCCFPFNNKEQIREICEIL